MIIAARARVTRALTLEHTGLDLLVFSLRCVTHMSLDYAKLCTINALPPFFNFKTDIIKHNCHPCCYWQETRPIREKTVASLQPAALRRLARCRNVTDASCCGASSSNPTHTSRFSHFKQTVTGVVHRTLQKNVSTLPH